MEVIIENVELRGYEEKKSKSSDNKYSLLYFEEFQTGKSYNVMCRDMFLLPKKFEKGLTCTLVCDLEIGGKFTSFELLDIVVS